jgi:hypothetical protein
LEKGEKELITNITKAKIKQINKQLKKYTHRHTDTPHTHTHTHTHTPPPPPPPPPPPRITYKKTRFSQRFEQ